MEWEKAKTIIIIFLLLINILLGSLLYHIDLKYSLSDENKRNLLSLLSEKGISLQGELVTKSRPMKKVELSPYIYDDQEFLTIFTESKVLEKRPNDDFQMTIFILEEETLSISPSKVVYETTSKKGGIHMPPLKACENFLEKMGQKSKGYELDSQDITDGTGSISYRQKFGKNLLYNNYIIFTFTDNAITSIEYSYSVPIGYLGEAAEIYSCDEALFAFTAAIRKESSEPLSITAIDIVYYGQDSLAAVPCYRLAYETQSGQKSTVLINAYTNKIEYPLYL